MFFLSNARNAEKRTASGKLFQTDVAAAEKHLPPMVARQVREVTRAWKTKREVADVSQHQKIAADVSLYYFRCIMQHSHAI